MPSGARPGHARPLRLRLQPALHLLAALAGAFLWACGGEDRPADEAPTQRAARHEVSGEVAGRVAGILRIVDPLERYAALSQALGELGPADGDSVIAAFDSVFVTQTDVEAMIAAAWLGREAPEAGLRWAQSDGAPVEAAVANRLFRGWASHDPAAAKAAIERLPERAQREASYGFIEGWEASGIDPAGLDTFLLELGLGVHRQHAVYLVAYRKTIRLGSEATMAWAESVEDSQDRYRLAVFRQVAGSLAYLDPPAAGRWAAKHMQGPWGSNLAKLAATRWARRDGPAALRWALALPEHSERNRALGEAFRQWMLEDPPAAREFAAALDRDDPSTEPVRASFLNLTSAEDPTAALAQLDTILDPERRMGIEFRIVRSWIRQDPEAAEEWMAENEVSDPVRTRLEALLEKALSEPEPQDAS